MPSIVREIKDPPPRGERAQLFNYVILITSIVGFFSLSPNISCY